MKICLASLGCVYRVREALTVSDYRPHVNYFKCVDERCFLVLCGTQQRLEAYLLQGLQQSWGEESFLQALVPGNLLLRFHSRFEYNLCCPSPTERSLEEWRGDQQPRFVNIACTSLDATKWRRICNLSLVEYYFRFSGWDCLENEPKVGVNTVHSPHFAFVCANFCVSPQLLVFHNRIPTLLPLDVSYHKTGAQPKN